MYILPQVRSESAARLPIHVQTVVIHLEGPEWLTDRFGALPQEDVEHLLPAGRVYALRCPSGRRRGRTTPRRNAPPVRSTALLSSGVCVREFIVSPYLADHRDPRRSDEGTAAEKTPLEPKTMRAASPSPSPISIWVAIPSPRFRRGPFWLTMSFALTAKRRYHPRPEMEPRRGCLCVRIGADWVLQRAGLGRIFE
jgi:hypothetical protein